MNLGDQVIVRATITNLYSGGEVMLQLSTGQSILTDRRLVEPVPVVSEPEQPETDAAKADTSTPEPTAKELATKAVEEAQSKLDGATSPQAKSAAQKKLDAATAALVALGE